MSDEYIFTTPCGHRGIIKPVRATGGKHEGKWFSKIEGPRVPGLTKTMYSPPDLSSALDSIARYIRTSPLNIRCLHASTSNASPSSVRRYERKDPSIQQYGKDVREPSPNSRATCKICRKRINRGELRVGKWTINRGFYPPRLVYYHDRCVSESFRQTLKLPDPGIQEKRNALLQKRRLLREQLRQMRLGFARYLNVQAYCIFPDATIDDITVRLPRTKSELLACHGIKEKRYRNFGTAILAITEAYARHGIQDTHCDPYREQSNAEGDDDAIEVTETLSIDDIVSKKFQDAEENGYVIEL